MWLCHDLDLSFSKLNFEIIVSQEWEAQLTWNERHQSPSDVGLLCDLELWHWPWIFHFKFWNSHSLRMGGLIDMEWKGFGSIGYWTYYVTLNFGLTHAWLWPWNFKIKFWNCHISAWMRGPIKMEWKGMWFDQMLDPLCDLKLWPHPWLWIGFSRSNFEIAVSQEWKSWLIGGKECELMGYLTHYVTLTFYLTYDLDIVFSLVKFWK